MCIVCVCVCLIGCALNTFKNWMEHLKTRLLDEMYVESRILDDGHLLEVAIELVPGLFAKDLA